MMSNKPKLIERKHYTTKPSFVKGENIIAFAQSETSKSQSQACLPLNYLAQSLLTR